MLLIPRLVNARKIEPIVRRVDEPLFERITLELYCLRLRSRRQGDADDQRIQLAGCGPGKRGCRPNLRHPRRGESRCRRRYPPPWFCGFGYVRHHDIPADAAVVLEGKHYGDTSIRTNPWLGTVTSVAPFCKTVLSGSGSLAAIFSSSICARLGKAGRPISSKLLITLP